MEIVFVRHGTPDYTLADQRQMTQLEKDYAPLTRDCIPFICSQSQKAVFAGADLMISSPYTRALQTAEILNRPLGLPLFVEHDLREWRADLAGGYIDLSERDRRWQEYRSGIKSGGTQPDALYESAVDLRSRALKVLQRYKDCKKVIVVAHFNVLESVLGYQKDGIGCGEFKVFSLQAVVSVQDTV
ncbi:histidine phosphatase family protein [Vibrio aerogenes]|nr:histidine phosphatase family protein [Vibrio aerogenes]